MGILFTYNTIFPLHNIFLFCLFNRLQEKEEISQEILANSYCRTSTQWCHKQFSHLLFTDLKQPYFLGLGKVKPLLLTKTSSSSPSSWDMPFRFLHAVMYDLGWIGRNPDNPEMRVLWSKPTSIIFFIEGSKVTWPWFDNRLIPITQQFVQGFLVLI